MKEKMKALRKEEPGIGAELREIRIPEVGEDELLIKVEKSAICGSDLHIWEWHEFARENTTLPFTFGHEFTGRVAKIGRNIKDFEEGDLIAGETHVPCGSCRLCRTGNQHICENMDILGWQTEGAFAEYIKIPKPCAWKLPDDFPTELAVIMEPVGGAVHVATTPDVNAKTVFISGAGPIGIAAMKTAKVLGATKTIITDVVPERLELAKDMGADVCLNPTEVDVREETRKVLPTGVDVVFEMAGNAEALNTGLDLLANTGEVVLFGNGYDTATIDAVNNIIYKEAKIHGVTGRKMYETWYQLTALIEEGVDYSPIITDHYDLTDYQDAFEKAKTRKGGKIVFEIGEE